MAFISTLSLFIIFQLLYLSHIITNLVGVTFYG